MSYFSSSRILLLCLLVTGFLSLSSPILHAKDFEKPADIDLVGAMYNAQQLQLETIKTQQRDDIDELSKEIAKIEADLKEVESSVNSQKRDIDEALQETTAIGKRVDDSLIYAGQSLDRFGIFITISVFLAGLVGYFTVTSKAKSEARDASKKWFDDNSRILQAQIKELYEKAQQGQKEIDDHVENFERYRDEAKIKIESIGTLSSVEKPHDEADKNPIVQKRADMLKNIPESKYQFDDWNTLAHAAYEESNFEDAAYYWLKASKSDNASELNIARTLFNRAVTQNVLKLPDVAIATYNEVVRRFGDATELSLKEQVAKALVNRGTTEGQLNQPDAEIATYNEVVRRFGDATELSLKERVAKALVNRSITEGRLNQPDAAIATYNEVVRRFGDATELSLKEQVAKALVNRGITEGQLNQPDAEIATYNEVVRRFGDATELSLKEQFAKALVNRGITEGQLNQPDAEIATYNEVVRRFGDATELSLKERVAIAFNGLGFERLCLGKKQLQDGESHQAQSLFEEALLDFDNALMYSEWAGINGVYLGNKSYITALLGNISEAETLFALALRAPKNGGELIYEATLADLKIHPVEQDEKVREFVERQWQTWLDEQNQK